MSCANKNPAPFGLSLKGNATIWTTKENLHKLAFADVLTCKVLD